MVEETGVHEGNHRDPRRKSLLYCATYLMPRAGIEPTPRTDIGYRPVTPDTSDARREPLGHHVPHVVVDNFAQCCGRLQPPCVDGGRLGKKYAIEVKQQLCTAVPSVITNLACNSSFLQRVLADVPSKSGK
jgi:hypothetical protein